MARGLNRAVLKQLYEDKDDAELVKSTWGKTQEEVALCYIWPDEQADPEQHFLAKRFGLVQRAGKLRVIDDCSIGGINSTISAVENSGYMPWMSVRLFLLTWWTTCKGAMSAKECLVAPTT